MKKLFITVLLFALAVLAPSSYAYPCDSAGGLRETAQCINDFGASGSMTRAELDAQNNPYFYVMVLNGDAGDGYATGPSSAPFLDSCYLRSYGNYGCDDINPRFPVAKEGQPYKVKVQVYNLGASGKMRIEAAIQTDSVLKSWGVPLSIVNSVPNCVSSQTNVGSVEMYLQSGRSEEIEIIIPKVPNIGILASITGFELYVQASNKCYSADGTMYVTSFKHVNFPIRQDSIIPIVPIGTPKSYDDYVNGDAHSNGIKDNGETDVDVGGDTGAPRGGLTARCVKGSDCETSYCDKGFCSEPPEEDYCKYTDDAVKCAMQRINENAATVALIVVTILGFAFVMWRK